MVRLGTSKKPFIFKYDSTFNGITETACTVLWSNIPEVNNLRLYSLKGEGAFKGEKAKFLLNSWFWLAGPDKDGKYWTVPGHIIAIVEKEIATNDYSKLRSGIIITENSMYPPGTKVIFQGADYYTMFHLNGLSKMVCSFLERNVVFVYE